MKIWWLEGVTQVWEIEQQLILLKEWVLMDPKQRSKVQISNTVVLTTIMNLWTKCQHKLSPIQSPLASFLYHPHFYEAVSIADFSIWEIAGFDKLMNWFTGQGVVTEADVIRKVGTFQYRQIRHLLNKLAQHGSLFWPLTDFEKFLISGPYVRVLSSNSL